MDTWIWIVIAVVAVAIVLLALLAVARRRQRTAHLQERFGPEYGRAVEDADSRRSAERDLSEREQRREHLDIRPLSPAARDRYAESWRDTQARFVDDPGSAVGDADRLVQQVMSERGYPTDDFEQRAADISVDHPDVVEHYRAAHGIALAHERGETDTEELRKSFVHYRTLFEQLLVVDDRERVEAKQ
jgi:hypothetical protein